MIETKHYILCNNNKYEVDYGTFVDIQFKVGHNYVDAVKNSKGDYTEIVLEVDESILPEGFIARKVV